jgi:hypothetical protein
MTPTPFRRRLMLGWAVGVMALLGASSAQAATQPIEGTWNLSQGKVLVQAQPDGSFSGTVVQPVGFAGCIHPVGQVIWSIQGSGLSYTGTHVWFNSKCGPNPGGQSTWKISNADPTKLTMIFCTAHPGDGPPDPSATAAKPVGATDCFTLSRALAPGQTPAAPVDTAPPTISGSPKAGQTLTCSTGTWTNDPTAYTYSWSRDGTPITGATGARYKVATGDEGLTLTCTVTAFNGGGAGNPATSRAVAIAVPVVKGCPRATGSIHGNSLGLARLGMTRTQVRRAYTKSSDRGRRYEDFFCLTPIGVRVGYASPVLLSAISKHRRAAEMGRVVWASTSSGFYSIKKIRPGATLAAAQKALHPAKPFHIGLNDWYLAANGASTAVLKVRHGIVEEIGVAVKVLTQGRKAQSALLHSFF